MLARFELIMLKTTRDKNKGTQIRKKFVHLPQAQTARRKIMAEISTQKMVQVIKPGLNFKLTSFHFAFGVVDGPEVDEIFAIVDTERKKQEDMSRRMAEMAAKGLADPSLVR